MEEAQKVSGMATAECDLAPNEAKEAEDRCRAVEAELKAFQDQ